MGLPQSHSPLLGHTMTYLKFTELVSNCPTGVILLEGRREIADGDAALVTQLA